MVLLTRAGTFTSLFSTQKVEREAPFLFIWFIMNYFSIQSIRFDLIILKLFGVDNGSCQHYMLLQHSVKQPPHFDRFSTEENKSFFFFTVDLDSPCSWKKKYMAPKKPLIVHAKSYLKGSGLVGYGTRSSIIVTELLLCLLLKNASNTSTIFVCRKSHLEIFVLLLFRRNFHTLNH